MLNFQQGVREGFHGSLTCRMIFSVNYRMDLSADFLERCFRCQLSLESAYFCLKLFQTALRNGDITISEAVAAICLDFGRDAAVAWLLS